VDDDSTRQRVVTSSLPGERPRERPAQQRAVHTREAVLRAAAEVFDRRGYPEATIDEIARQAEATKGAVYFHFPSKAALAKAVVDEQHVAWARLAAASSGWQISALDKVGRLIRDVTRTYRDNPHMRAGVQLANAQAQIEVELTTPFVGWMQRINALLREGQRDGSVSAGLNCAAAARVIVASFYGVEEVSARLQGRDDLERRVREWWALLRPGLASNPSP
jgi:AcrR family transcriptional regulator